MIDKDIEMSWEVNSTSPNLPKAQATIRMKFTELKVLTAASTELEQMEYMQQIEQNNSLGINNGVELPDGMKPSFGKRSFNFSEILILNWSHMWDEEYDCDMIICEMFYPRIGRMETINGLYSKKEWIQVLTKLGYDCE